MMTDDAAMVLQAVSKWVNLRMRTIIIIFIIITDSTSHLLAMIDDDLALPPVNKYLVASSGD